MCKLHSTKEYKSYPLLVCAENRGEGKLLQKTHSRSEFSSAWLCMENNTEKKISRKLCVEPTVAVFRAIVRRKCKENWLIANFILCIYKIKL